MFARQTYTAEIILNNGAVVILSPMEAKSQKNVMKAVLSYMTATPADVLAKVTAIQITDSKGNMNVWSGTINAA